MKKKNAKCNKKNKLVKFKNNKNKFNKINFIYFTIFFLIIFNNTTAQISEIASIVTSLLSNSGTSLAGLAGTGSSLAGTGAAASSGITGVLSNVAPLYQFAQAALQLTGTGVGIANQASEGAWFPVVVENAAKINRDFQEKLLTRSSSRNIDNRDGLTSGSKFKNIVKISQEYGKNFESEEINDYENNEQNQNERKETENLIPIDKSYLKFLVNKDMHKTSDLNILLPGESVSEYNNKDQFLLNKPNAKIKSKLKKINETYSLKKNKEIIPKLNKLIQTLKTSNLSQEEFTEISNQLESNAELLKPRKNLIVSQSNLFNVNADNKKNNASLILKVTNPKRDKAAARNLMAFQNIVNNKPNNKNYSVLKQNDSQVSIVLVLNKRQNNTNDFDGQDKTNFHNVIPYPRYISTNNVLQKNKEKIIEKNKTINFSSNKTLTFKKTLNGVQTQRKIECPVISLNSKFQPKFTKTNNNNQKFYNKDYRNYISYYYPEYATYYNYNYHHQQPANLQTNFLKNNILQKKQQIYKEQKNNNIPVRTVSVSIFTTPPSTLLHPYGQETSLTIMQPTYLNPQFFG